MEKLTFLAHKFNIEGLLCIITIQKSLYGFSLKMGAKTMLTEAISLHVAKQMPTLDGYTIYVYLRMADLFIIKNQA